jgi:hypothetical protein
MDACRLKNKGNYAFNEYKSARLGKCAGDSLRHYLI